MPPKIGARSRLPSGVPSQSKEFFSCVVANRDLNSVKGRVLPMPPNGNNYLTQENAGISS